MTAAAAVALVVRYGLVLLFLPFSALDKIFGFNHAVRQAQQVFSARPVAIAAYAEDAVRWHHRRAHQSGRTLRRDQDRVAEWRRENPLGLNAAVDAAYRRR